MISKYAEWVDVWQELVKYGWSCQTGDSLANYIFYSKKCQDMTPKQVRKDFIENQDYFTSEDSVKQFIRDQYGWKGPEGKKKSSRKRKRMRSKNSLGEPNSSKKKKGVGEEQGNDPIQPDQCHSYDGPRELMGSYDVEPHQEYHRSDGPLREEQTRYYSHYGDHSATSSTSARTPEIKEQSEEDYSFGFEANKKCRKGVCMKDRLDVLSSCLGVEIQYDVPMFQRLKILEGSFFGLELPRQGLFVDRIEELEGQMGI